MYGVESYAEVSPLNFALRDQLFVDKTGFVRRQCESDAVIVTSRSRDLRIHADNFATHIDEWSTTVATVDGCVCLQEALKHVEVRTFTFLLRNNSGSDCLIQAEGRTHGQHPVADLRCVRITKRDC